MPAVALDALVFRDDSFPMAGSADNGAFLGAAVPGAAAAGPPAGGASSASSLHGLLAADRTLASSGSLEGLALADLALHRQNICSANLFLSAWQWRCVFRVGGAKQAHTRVCVST